MVLAPVVAAPAPGVRRPRVRRSWQRLTDVDPIGTAALDPTRRQMRTAVRRAVGLILRAEDELAEASDVIANGYLRLDHQEWIRVVERRRAALAPFPQSGGWPRSASSLSPLSR